MELKELIKKVEELINLITGDDELGNLNVEIRIDLDAHLRGIKQTVEAVSNYVEFDNFDFETKDWKKLKKLLRIEL